MTYYNEHDPKAAAWIRALIDAGHLPAGHVDTRDIRLVQPADLLGYTQCHFFAGIGGWALALRLAGVPDDFPVWTGSCPCQPFSVAGKRHGTKDPRHLWPHFRRLIRRCRPPVVFGEQVASADGRDWLSGVFADLEALAYLPAGADLCAASVGPEAEGWMLRGDTAEWEPVMLSAPHIRQRLWWVARGLADYQSHGRERRQNAPGETRWSQPESSSANGGLEHTPGLGRQQWRTESGGRSAECGCSDGGTDHRLADAHKGQCRRLPTGQGCQCHGQTPGRQQSDGQPECDCANGGLADAQHAERRSIHEHRQNECHGQDLGWQETHRQPGTRGEICGPWSVFDLIPCRDGKTRRIESGTFPLAHGIPGRVGLLRGYGNAIVPQVAAEFIQASLEALAL